MKQIISLLCLTSFIVYGNLKPGTMAPELHLKKIFNSGSEESLKLADLKEEVIVLDFWATWCRPCVAAMPKYNELYNKYKDKGVNFIGITDEKTKVVNEFIGKVNLDFVIGITEEGIDFKNYEVTARPTLYIINQSGEIVYSGYSITEELLEEVIQTGNVEHKKSKQEQQRKEAIVFGGFSPGEDPVYNGMRIMTGKERDQRSKIISQFILRPSLDTVHRGSGYSYNRGYFGITYSHGKLESMISFLYDLPTDLWVSNKTDYTDNYDLIYRKKAENMEKGYYNLLNELLEAFEIRIDTLSVTKEVNVLYLKNESEEIIDSKKVDKALNGAYRDIYFFTKRLGRIEQEFFIPDDELLNKMVYILNTDQLSGNELIQEKNPERIIDFLHSVGIEIQKEEREIELYEIQKR